MGSAASRALVLNAIVLAATLSGCAPPDARWEQEVYVWQRGWTQAVSDAVRKASPFLNRFRLLSAQWRANDVPLLVDLRPDVDLFRGAKVVAPEPTNSFPVSASAIMKPEGARKPSASSIRVRN